GARQRKGASDYTPGAYDSSGYYGRQPGVLWCQCELWLVPPSPGQPCDQFSGRLYVRSTTAHPLSALAHAHPLHTRRWRDGRATLPALYRGGFTQYFALWVDPTYGTRRGE